MSNNHQTSCVFDALVAIFFLVVIAVEMRVGWHRIQQDADALMAQVLTNDHFGIVSTLTLLVADMIRGQHVGP